MMSMKNKKIICIIVAISFVSLPVFPYAIPINLFAPYDVLIRPALLGSLTFSCAVTAQTLGHIHGFQCNDDTNHDSIKTNPMQLWQDTQDGIAAFKGAPLGSGSFNYAQKLNWYDDNNVHGIFTPCGDFHVPVAIFGGFSWHIVPSTALTLYVPFYVMKLNTITWTEKHTHTSYEDVLTPDLLGDVQTYGSLCLKNSWQRSGFGDAALRLSWGRDFPQVRHMLRHVRTIIHGGLTFPTGRKADEDLPLAIPFGADGALGLLFGGSIELYFVHNMRLLCDVDFFQAMSTTDCRRFKTDPAQTDLMFINKVMCYKSPGFTQHFTVGLGRFWWQGKFSFDGAYQYTKHNDDTYYPCHTDVDQLWMNDSWSAREWTIHQCVFTAAYLGHNEPEDRWCSECSLSYQYGFQGKRSLIGQGLSVRCAVIF